MPSPAVIARPRIDAPPETVAAGLIHLEGFVFLDSACADSWPGSASILAALPRRIVRGHISDTAELRRAMQSRQTPDEVDLGIPLGGAFGYVEFDGGFVFGIYDDVLIFDHDSETWFEVGDLSRHIRDEDGSRMAAPMSFAPLASREWFCDAVRTAQEYIAAGDIYQVNLSQKFQAPWQGDGEGAFRFYEGLRECSPAPYSAFLNLGGKCVASSSPECFLKMSGNVVTTRPIKGTRPRFRNTESDERSAYDLITSQKEVSELVMITDLERNDLGRVCEFGSVEVTELLKLERFEQVFHLVSTVRGTVRPEFSHLDVLNLCFPGGSISGAPKKRALEIIAELEPIPRGLYTGAIGYLGWNGESQFNIAIRTAVFEDDYAHFHVGAGIVADSIPEKEYEETLHKAAGILRAAEFFD